MRISFFLYEKHSKNSIHIENDFSALKCRICIIIWIACQQDLVLIKSIFNATSMSFLIKSCFRGGKRHENLFVCYFYVIGPEKHGMENELETFRDKSESEQEKLRR